MAKMRNTAENLQPPPTLFIINNEIQQASHTAMMRKKCHANSLSALSLTYVPLIDGMNPQHQIMMQTEEKNPIQQA